MAKKSPIRSANPAQKKKPAVSLASSLSVARNPAFADHKAPDDTVTRQIAIDRIQPRIGRSVRLINPGHVVDLAESVAAIGLLEPLVVDVKNRILAGDHRRCACLLLLKLRDSSAENSKQKEQIESLFKQWGTDPKVLPIGELLLKRISELDTAAFQKNHPGGNVPIRILPIDSESNLTAALNAEIAENDKRRDFSTQEVKGLAQTLKDKGYTDTRGRPAAGAKPLMPALQTIIGKSSRQLYRLLSTDAGKPATAKPPMAIQAVLRVLPRLDTELEAESTAQASAALAVSRNLAEMLQTIVKTRAANSKKKSK